MSLLRLSHGTGEDGNVAAGAVTMAEGFSDLVGVSNLLPASGGRNSESIEEIIRRAPSVLTSRDGLRRDWILRSSRRRRRARFVRPVTVA